MRTRGLYTFHSLSCVLQRNIAALVFNSGQSGRSRRSGKTNGSTLLRYVTINVANDPLEGVHSRRVVGSTTRRYHVTLHFVGSSTTRRLLIGHHVPHGKTSSIDYALCHNNGRIMASRTMRPSISTCGQCVLSGLNVAHSRLLGGFVLSGCQCRSFLSSSSGRGGRIVGHFSGNVLISRTVTGIRRSVIPLSRGGQRIRLRLTKLSKHVKVLRRRVHGRRRTKTRQKHAHIRHVVKLRATVTTGERRVHAKRRGISELRRRLTKIRQTSRTLRRLRTKSATLRTYLRGVTRVVSLFPSTQRAS